MPRRAVRVLPAVLLGTMLGLGACAAPEALRTGNTTEVAVSIWCVGDRVGVAIDPWRRRVPLGDALQWVLTVDSGQVSDFKVDATDRNLIRQRHWPYKNKNQTHVSDRIPARFEEMRGNPREAPYPYKVSFTCANGDARHSIVIDPDVVVD